jgi:hypothetical protein
VIAPEHERKAALLERRERGPVQLFADAGDLADVLLAGVAKGLGLRDWRDEVAFVGDRYPERRQTLAEACDSKRGGPHVDAAAIAAEVERDADDVNRTHADGLYHSVATVDATGKYQIV